MKTCSDPGEEVGLRMCAFLVAWLDLRGTGCRRRITRESSPALSKIIGGKEPMRRIEESKFADVWLSSTLAKLSGGSLHRRARRLKAVLRGIWV
jgi:hypothetical protein